MASSDLIQAYQKRSMIDGNNVLVELERMSARALYQDRYARRSHLLQVIFEVKKDQLASQEGVLTLQHEVLRVVCQTLSRPSQLFAQCLVQAAAIAC